MALEFTLDNPILGVQYERNALDAYLRNFVVLRRYSKINNFGDELDAILIRHGGEKLASLDVEDLPEEEKQKMGGMLPTLKRAIDTAQIELKDEIDAGRKGVKPFIDSIDYRFKNKDGRLINFKLDPDARAYRTLQEFEQLLYSLPNGEEIEAQFLPTFQLLRREMVNWGWDEKDASPQATLLTIKKLCDQWSNHG